jgi:hypothetical protein
MVIEPETEPRAYRKSQPLPVFNAPREQVRGWHSKTMRCLVAINVARPAGDAEPLCDLLGRGPCGEQAAHLSLPGSQSVDMRRDRPAKPSNRHAPDANFGKRNAPHSNLLCLAVERLRLPAGDTAEERGLAANGICLKQVSPRELSFQLVEPIRRYGSGRP